MAKLKFVNVVLCGPGDVTKEVEIARKVIGEWDRPNGSARGVTLKHRHWSTDTYPDAAQSGQGAVNRQMIDQAHVLVAVFWSRLGTPTHAAESGTAEEIRRGLARGRPVLVYFSDLEAVAAAYHGQVERLWQWRQQLMADSSCSTFRSRAQFQR